MNSYKLQPPALVCMYVLSEVNAPGLLLDACVRPSSNVLFWLCQGALASAAPNNGNVCVTTNTTQPITSRHTSLMLEEVLRRCMKWK